MSETTELIVVEPASVHDVFTKVEKLDPILAQIRQKALSIVSDTSTAKGRAEIRSRAFQVTKTKTYLEGLGKDLVTEMKKLPGLVDASRKKMRDDLDKLANEVRQPLTEWEAEQARIEAEARAAEEAAAMAKRLESDHELALLMNEKFDRDLADAKEREANEAREREARIAQAAKEEAERAAAAEIQAAQRREQEAREAVERADQARKDAEARAEQERKQAEERAERARQQAIEQERQRAEAERQRAENERAKREADAVHRGNINRAVLADMMETGLNEEQAKATIRAIVSGKVRHTAITY